MEISQVRKARHVGVTFDASLKMFMRCCEASQKGTGSFMALAGRGVRPNGLNSITCCNLLRLIVLSRALYGCELWWKLTKSDILVLERMLRFCVKHIQWFQSRTRSDKALNLVGMPRVVAIMDKMKLLFVWRLHEMPGDCVAKQIFMYQASSYMLRPYITKYGSFTEDIFKVFNKYNLSHVMERILQFREWPDKQIWNEMVVTAIVEFENAEFEYMTVEDSNFKFFREVLENTAGPYGLWIAAREIPNSIGLFTNVAKILVTFDSWFYTEPQLCHLCGFMYEHPYIHGFTSCSYYSEKREQLWNFINNNLPIKICVYLNSLSDEQFTAMLMGHNFLNDLNIDWPVECWFILLYRFAIYINSLNII